VDEARKCSLHAGRERAEHLNDRVWCVVMKEKNMGEKVVGNGYSVICFFSIHLSPYLF